MEKYNSSNNFTGPLQTCKESQHKLEFTKVMKNARQIDVTNFNINNNEIDINDPKSKDCTIDIDCNNMHKLIQIISNKNTEIKNIFLDEKKEIIENVKNMMKNNGDNITIEFIQQIAQFNNKIDDIRRNEIKKLLTGVKILDVNCKINMKYNNELQLIDGKIILAYISKELNTNTKIYVEIEYWDVYLNKNITISNFDINNLCIVGNNCDFQTMQNKQIGGHLISKKTVQPSSDSEKAIYICE